MGEGGETGKSRVTYIKVDMEWSFGADSRAMLESAEKIPGQLHVKQSGEPSPTAISSASL